MTFTVYYIPYYTVMEMTTLLSLTVTNKPLKVGQWVRLRRGVLKVSTD